MKKYFVLLCCCLLSFVCFAQPPARNRVPISGRLGFPFGDTFTVRGIVADGPTKGYEDGPNLLIQAIRDSVIQDIIQFPLDPITGSFGYNALPALSNDKTYRFLVYETGAFVGTPAAAFAASKTIFQTSGFYFSERLVAARGEIIKPITWVPANFVGRSALIGGIAINAGDTAGIQTSDGLLLLQGPAAWESHELGKQVEAFGVVREYAPGKYTMLVERSGLVRLEDMVGREVHIRGQARSMNGCWWLHYRGTDLQVENMGDLPGWETNIHFASVEISGMLYQEKLPELDCAGIGMDRKKTLQFIIRNASWRKASNLLQPEAPKDID